MKTKREVEAVVTEYASRVKALLGDKLEAVILYGSFARGDYEDGSDVDVMVLVNVPQDQQKEHWDIIADIAFELGWEHNLLISPILQSVEIFERYKDASGFFKNVLSEGVRISA